jgi:acyl-CoA thioesterase YciA
MYQQKHELDEAGIRIPAGELITRTIAMPGNTNANGDIFGGWIMSQMDIASGIIAKSIARTRVATVAVDGMSFLHPVLVGDTVACYGKLVKVGRTSMNISIEVWSQRFIQSAHICVTEAQFTYVAIDDDGKPTPVER